MPDEVSFGPDQALPVVQGNTVVLSVASHPSATGKKGALSTAVADDEVSPTQVYVVASGTPSVTGRKGAAG